MHFQWSAKCKATFVQQCKVLEKNPVLKSLDQMKPFIVHTFIVHIDTSDVGLSQSTDTWERVVEFYSQSFFFYAESLAVQSLRHFRPFLYGYKFHLHTDYASLTWLLSFKSSEGQLTWWTEALQEYKLTMLC